MFLIIESNFQPWLKNLFKQVKDFYVVNPASDTEFYNYLNNLSKRIISSSSVSDAVLVQNSKDGKLYFPNFKVEGDNVYAQLFSISSNLSIREFITVQDSILNILQPYLLGYYIFDNSIIFKAGKCNVPIIQTGNNSYVYDSFFKQYVIKLELYNYLKISLNNCIKDYANQAKAITICGLFKDLMYYYTQGILFNFFNLSKDNGITLFISDNGFYYYVNDNRYYTRKFDRFELLFPCLSVKILNDKEVRVKIYVNGQLERTILLPNMFDKFEGNLGLIGEGFENGESGTNDPLIAKLSSFLILDTELNDILAQMLYTITKQV